MTLEANIKIIEISQIYFLQNSIFYDGNWIHRCLATVTIEGVFIGDHGVRVHVSGFVFCSSDRLVDTGFQIPIYEAISYQKSKSAKILKKVANPQF